MTADSYEDIIHLPHHVSGNRSHMSLYDRAAQFAPFAALTGYEDKISESFRQTEKWIETDEERIMILNQKFQILEEMISKKPTIKVTYFVPDLTKEGGSYKEETVEVLKIDLLERRLISTDHQKYELDYIIDINGDIFDRFLSADE